MRNAIFTLTVLLQLGLTGCQENERELTPTERDKIGSDVRTTLESYLDAIRTGGLMAEFAYLDSSEDFFWVPPGYTSALSYDSVATILRTNAGRWESIDHRWETLEIHPLSHRTAVYTGVLNSITVDTSGNRSEFRMIETGVVIKRADGWKILSGQSRVLN